MSVASPEKKNTNNNIYTQLSSSVYSSVCSFFVRCSPIKKLDNKPALVAEERKPSFEDNYKVFIKNIRGNKLDNLSSLIQGCENDFRNSLLNDQNLDLDTRNKSLSIWICHVANKKPSSDKLAYPLNLALEALTETSANAHPPPYTDSLQELVVELCCFSELGKPLKQRNPKLAAVSQGLSLWTARNQICYWRRLHAILCNKYPKIQEQEITEKISELITYRILHNLFDNYWHHELMNEARYDQGKKAQEKIVKALVESWEKNRFDDFRNLISRTQEIDLAIEAKYSSVNSKVKRDTIDEALINCDLLSGTDTLKRKKYAKGGGGIVSCGALGAAGASVFSDDAMEYFDIDPGELAAYFSTIGPGTIITILSITFKQLSSWYVFSNPIARQWFLFFAEPISPFSSELDDDAVSQKVQQDSKEPQKSDVLNPIIPPSVSSR